MGTQVRTQWAAALFDLDGTLVDTRPGICEALAAAFAEVTGVDVDPGYADLSLPLDDMIRSIDPRAPQEVRESLSAAFRRHYDSSHWQLAGLYPGAMECLRDLFASGVRVFVVTNKRGRVAQRLLEHFHLAHYLEGVVGQPDDGPPVPKMELAARCIETAGLDPATTIVVGDSNQDASMAAWWGMAFIGVTSGTGPLSHVRDEDKRVEVTSLDDVKTLVLAGRRGRQS